MNKVSVAVLIAVTASCFNLGDRKPVGAQPLEIQMAVHVAGPPIVIQKPLSLSLDQRMDAQQIAWECRMRSDLQSKVTEHRNTSASSATQNPFPALSAALGDVYALIGQS